VTQLYVAVMHVPGIPERAAALSALLHRVPTAQVFQDPDRQGAWWNARRCWEAGIASGADWIVVMNDDALPCAGFLDVATRALATRDKDSPVCFYVATERAKGVTTPWMTTHDAVLGVACALSREAAIDFLEWHDHALTVPWTDDGRVALWAMATGRLVYTTLPGLVEHQLPASSLVGNESDDCRTAAVPPLEDMSGVDWTGPATHVGRHFNGNHWELPFRTRPDAWDLEAVYLAERQGVPLSTTAHVFIATPAYGGPKLGYLRSVDATVRDLEAHGIMVTRLMTGGDSLITRGRHHLCHDFLRTQANYLLQWDADVECLDPTAVRCMIESGHPVIGGAYPWRDGSGRVVCNPLQGAGRHRITVENQCTEVAEVGTGFMLTKREVLIDLMQRHPEALYESDFPDYPGHPIWALFDVHLEPTKSGRRRYASEDWRFCSLAREAGHKVYVYLPPTFLHWGDHGNRGHITTAWKMGDLVPVAEAAA
jgi:hypothetical protein